MPDEQRTRAIYWNQPDGEPFTDKDGAEVVGWADRFEGEEPTPELIAALIDECGPFYGTITARPVLCREATEVECQINGWEEGTFVRCTARAKNARPYWQFIEEDNPDA